MEMHHKHCIGALRREFEPASGDETDAKETEGADMGESGSAFPGVIRSSSPIQKYCPQLAGTVALLNARLSFSPGLLLPKSLAAHSGRGSPQCTLQYGGQSPVPPGLADKGSLQRKSAFH